MADPTVQSRLNDGNPTSLPEMCRRVKLGDFLSALDSILNVASTHEVVTVTANVGVLSKPAMAILGCDARAGGTIGIVSAMADDATLVTKSYKVALDRKTITFFATDAVTSAVVNYIPVPAIAPSNATTLAALVP